MKFNEDKMKRGDFLKLCWAGLIGLLAIKGSGILNRLPQQGLKEARFYRSADTLLG